MNLPWGRTRKLDGGAEPPPERRRCMRHRVHAPAFASFDGVTGGMVLDLSEQGMSMQTAAPQKVTRPINLHLNLPNPVTNLVVDLMAALKQSLAQMEGKKKPAVRVAEAQAASETQVTGGTEHHRSTRRRRTA